MIARQPDRHNKLSLFVKKRREFFALFFHRSDATSPKFLWVALIYALSKTIKKYHSENARTITLGNNGILTNISPYEFISPKRMQIFMFIVNKDTCGEEFQKFTFTQVFKFGGWTTIASICQHKVLRLNGE